MTNTTNPIHALAGEKLLTLAAAARELPSRTGGHAHAATLWRWISAGVKTPSGRVKLQAVRIGSLTYTSAEALARFLATLNAPPPQPAPIPTAGQRDREMRRAKARAERAGRKLARMGL